MFSLISIVLKVVRCSWISHQTPIAVYIEFAWNYAGFNSNYYYFMRIPFGKSTHISMISNSLTHLQSYTNSAIAGNSAASSADSVTSNGECFMMFHNVLRVFHDVLRVFHNVLLVVHNVLQHYTMYHKVLQVFHDVLLCFNKRFTMFSESRNDRHRQLPIASGIMTMLQRLVITPQKLAITSQKSAMMPQGLSLLLQKWSYAKLRPEWRRVTLSLENNFRRGWELRSYENPQIAPISYKIIPPSVTAEFQYGGQLTLESALQEIMGRKFFALINLTWNFTLMIIKSFLKIWLL